MRATPSRSTWGAQHAEPPRATHNQPESIQIRVQPLFPTTISGRACSFFEEYGRTAQGLLDWFESRLRVQQTWIYSDWFVCCMLMYSTPSRSPLVLFWTSCTGDHSSSSYWFSNKQHYISLSPPRSWSASIVSPKSCRSHESLRDWCYPHCCVRSKDHLLWLNPVCERIGYQVWHPIGWKWNLEKFWGKVGLTKKKNWTQKKSWCWGKKYKFQKITMWGAKSIFVKRSDDWPKIKLCWKIVFWWNW